jgi:site-specific DNA recombinase
VRSAREAPVADRWLEAHNFAGEKQRLHNHYLKGSIFCGSVVHTGHKCGCRLIVCNAKSRSKQIYPYFICIGRQRNPRSCDQRAMRIERVDQAIVDFYRSVELAPDLRMAAEQMIMERIAELREGVGEERSRLVKQQKLALAQRAKLLEAHYADAIPLDLLRAEQARIGGEQDYIEMRLGSLELRFEVVERNLKAALGFTGDLYGAYGSAVPAIRRQMNQALFERILISDDGDITGELRAPFGLLFQAVGQPASEDGRRLWRGVGERSPARSNRRNGYRERRSDTRAGTIDLRIPKLREGSYFPD